MVFCAAYPNCTYFLPGLTKSRRGFSVPERTGAEGRPCRSQRRGLLRILHGTLPYPGRTVCVADIGRTNHTPGQHPGKGHSHPAMSEKWRSCRWAVRPQQAKQPHPGKRRTRPTHCTRREWTARLIQAGCKKPPPELKPSTIPASGWNASSGNAAIAPDGRPFSERMCRTDADVPVCTAWLVASARSVPVTMANLSSHGACGEQHPHLIAPDSVAPGNNRTPSARSFREHRALRHVLLTAGIRRPDPARRRPDCRTRYPGLCHVLCTDV